MRSRITHPEFSTNDLMRIYNILGEELFDVFDKNMEKQIQLLFKYPESIAARLKYGELAEYGYQVVRFHSNVQEGKADMRLIYRYVAEKDELQFFAVGFRWEKPDNVYYIAKKRSHKDFVFNES